MVEKVPSSRRLPCRSPEGIEGRRQKTKTMLNHTNSTFPILSQILCKIILSQCIINSTAEVAPFDKIRLAHLRSSGRAVEVLSGRAEVAQLLNEGLMIPSKTRENLPELVPRSRSRA